MSQCRTSAAFGKRMPQVSPLPSGRSPRDRFGLSMRIQETGTSSLGVLPSELLKEIFKQYVRIERARYVELIRAPRGEYSIHDYIQEHGQPVRSIDNNLNLKGKGLTSLGGLELVDNPEQITGIDLADNYFSNYYDPYLDPYVYYVVHNMTTPIEPFRRFPYLKYLYLSNNQLTTLPAGIFRGLQNLNTLRLNNNQLTALPVGVYGGLQNLKNLVQNNNQLTTFPAGIFRGLQNLEYLWLNDNQLTTLPVGVFGGLQNLVHLWLNNNQLTNTTLPAGVFRGLQNLKFLDLYKNRLNGTREEFGEVHRLGNDISIHWHPQYCPRKSCGDCGDCIILSLWNSHFPTCPSQAHLSRFRI